MDLWRLFSPAREELLRCFRVFDSYASGSERLPESTGLYLELTRVEHRL